jgi:hypothetical protein
MRLRLLALLSIVAALPAGSAGASGTAAVSPATSFGSGSVGIRSVSWTHDDCVGPGLPGTAGPHVTHTDNVSGFEIDPARIVNFNLSTLALFGAGICPTTVGGPVLPQDFTGHWHLTAVCRGSNNDGAVFINWTVDAVAGVATSSGFAGGQCIGTLGQAFSLDVTIEISSTTVLGLVVQPIGGVQIGITQA